MNIYHEGNDVVCRRSANNKKGEYDPGDMKIILYPDNAESDYDLNITILHEFIHARSHIKLDRPTCGEKVVEAEAVETYRKKPHILSLIKDIYRLK